MDIEKGNNLASFEGRQMRKVYHKGEWWFAVVDIVEALTGSSIPKRYWSDLKRKLIAEGYSEVSEKIGQLKMTAPDGKQRLTDCANTETLFRIIQSIPSPKVEPFKRWLARVGKERIDEIENPELAMARMQELFDPDHAGRSHDHQAAPGAGFQRHGSAEKGCTGRRGGGWPDAQGHRGPNQPASHLER